MYNFIFIVLKGFNLHTVILQLATLFGVWFTCKKAGVSDWKVFVPFYNLFILAKIGRKSNFLPVFIFLYSFTIMITYFLILRYQSFDQIVKMLFPGSTNQAFYISGFIGLFFLAIYIMLITFVISIPIIIALFLLYKSIAISFGKGGWFAFGLTVLPFIFWPILGFNSSTYTYKDEHALPESNSDVPLV